MKLRMPFTGMGVLTRENLSRDFAMQVQLLQLSAGNFSDRSVIDPIGAEVLDVRSCDKHHFHVACQGNDCCSAVDINGTGLEEAAPWRNAFSPCSSTTVTWRPT
jgi:hypothetical protein